MYIDTSCLVAYYMPEPMSSFVQEKIKSADEILISLITDIEILSAFKKKERIGEMNSKDADRAFQLYKNHRKNGLFKTAELSPSIFKASEFVLQTTSMSLRTLDAIHLGIAYEYKFKLFTFDQVLLDSAKELNIRTVNVI